MPKRKYKSSVKARRRAKKWYQDHKERAKKKARLWERANPKKVSASRKRRRKQILKGQRRAYRARRKYYIQQSRKWALENPKRRREISNKSAKRAYRRKILKKFRLTELDVSNMLSRQKGRCAICRHEFGPKGPGIDHCHKTNRVRGLLCMRCNFGLGLFRDSKKILSSAIDYL